MFYDYHFFGMHMFWWFFWILMMFLLFGWFEPVPRKKIRRDTPLDTLQRKLAAGELTIEEYQEKKRILEADAPMQARHA